MILIPASSTLIDAVVTVERVEGAGEGRLLIYKGDAYEVRYYSLF